MLLLCNSINNLKNLNSPRKKEKEQQNSLFTCKYVRSLIRVLFKFGHLIIVVPYSDLTVMRENRVINVYPWVLNASIVVCNQENIVPYAVACDLNNETRMADY